MDREEQHLKVVTDANVYYVFSNVTPGIYSLTDSAITGYTPSSATAGTVNGGTDGTNGTNQIGAIALGSGDIGVNYDFVEAVKAPPPVRDSCDGFLPQKVVSPDLSNVLESGELGSRIDGRFTLTLNGDTRMIPSRASRTAADPSAWSETSNTRSLVRVNASRSNILLRSAQRARPRRSSEVPPY